MDHQGAAADPTAGPHHPAEVGTVPQASGRRQHVRPVSGGKARAALETAGSEDGTAGTGTHAQPEAVGLRTTAVVRLEGALAHVEVSITAIVGLTRGSRLGETAVEQASLLTAIGRPRVRVPTTAVKHGHRDTPDERPGLWTTPCLPARAAVSVISPVFPPPMCPETVRAFSHARCRVASAPRRYVGVRARRVVSRRPSLVTLRVHRLWTSVWTKASAQRLTGLPVTVCDSASA